MVVHKDFGIGVNGQGISDITCEFDPLDGILFLSAEEVASSNGERSRCD